MMAYIQENGKTLNVSVKENGDKFYYLNNKLHRERGPAIELAAGGSAWYFEGDKVACSSQKEFEKIIGLKKEAAAQRYFDVKIEGTMPFIQTYRIFAKNAEEALQKTKTATPKSTQYKLPAKRNIKATIYRAGTMMVELVKNLLG
jgi:hypothetical protein